MKIPRLSPEMVSRQPDQTADLFNKLLDAHYALEKRIEKLEQRS